MARVLDLDGMKSAARNCPFESIDVHDLNEPLNELCGQDSLRIMLYAKFQMSLPGRHRRESILWGVESVHDVGRFRWNS